LKYNKDLYQIWQKKYKDKENYNEKNDFNFVNE
jgi:hypothetical protein